MRLYLVLESLGFNNSSMKNTKVLTTTETSPPSNLLIYLSNTTPRNTFWPIPDSSPNQKREKFFLIKRVLIKYRAVEENRQLWIMHGLGRASVEHDP